MSNKKLSILIYSLASGGAERVASLLLWNLRDRYDITLFLMNDTIFYEIPKDIKIVYLEKSNPRESGIKKLLKLPFLALKYKKLNESDISLSFMNRPNYVNILAKLFGMKSRCIVSERGTPSLQYQVGLQGKINKILIEYLYKKADLVIANSIRNSLDLKNNFNINKFTTINNLFDLDKIEKFSQEKVDIDNSNFTFITIGRLDSGKNHKLLLEAIKDLDAKLYIIGDGELREGLEFRIEDLKCGDRVKLLGRQKNPYKFLSKADCFVFSSNYEGFPNVLVEALACGLPVISTDCLSGPREILAPNSDIGFQLKDEIELAKYGVLTPVGDVKKMSIAMKMIINDSKLREKYKKRAFKRAKDFDVEKIIKEWEKVIEQCSKN